ncbi:MAG: oligosaccharide flippase family protein, partial [Oscillospiraceae bacterium]|nr:oligosaccharide flippase family protein [Oscillospiraceae bacterium]
MDNKDILSKEDKRIYTLREEEPVRAVLKMGVPLIAGMLIMVLYNLVDTYFVGLMHNDLMLAAVNLAYPVMMVTIAISNMVGTGASSFIARCLGMDDRQKAEHTLTAGMVLTVVNSIVVMTVGSAALPKLVVLLGAREGTVVYTTEYLRPILIGSLSTMGN